MARCLIYALDRTLIYREYSTSPLENARRPGPGRKLTEANVRFVPCDGPRPRRVQRRTLHPPPSCRQLGPGGQAQTRRREASALLKRGRAPSQ